MEASHTDVPGSVMVPNKPVPEIPNTTPGSSPKNKDGKLKSFFHKKKVDTHNEIGETLPNEPEDKSSAEDSDLSDVVVSDKAIHSPPKNERHSHHEKSHSHHSKDSYYIHDKNSLGGPKKKITISEEEATKLYNRGIVYEKIGDYDKAARYLNQALAMSLFLYSEDHPFIAMVKSALKKIKAKSFLEVATDDSDDEEDSRHEDDEWNPLISPEVHDTPRTNNGSIEKKDSIYISDICLKDTDFDTLAMRSAPRLAFSATNGDGPNCVSFLTMPTHEEDPFIELYCDGLANFQMKQYQESAECFEEAIGETPDEDKEESNLPLALMLEHHGDALYKLGKFDEADKSYQKAVDIHQRKSSSREEEHLAKIMMKRGDIQMSLGNNPCACVEYKASLKCWEILLAKENQDIHDEKTNYAQLCHILYNAGILNVKLHEFGAAEELFEELLSISQDSGLGNHRMADKLSIWANNAIGNIRMKDGHYKEAIEYYKTALRLHKMHHKQTKKKMKNSTNAAQCVKNYLSHEKLIGLYTNLGKAFLHEAQLEKAMIYFQKADRILTEEPQKDELELASIWTQMGKICFRRGDYDEAREYYSDALRLEKRVLMDDNSQQHLLLRHNIALTYCKEGNYDKGLEIMEDVLEKEKNVVRENCLYVAKIHLDICAVHVKLGNVLKMNSFFHSASRIMEEYQIPKNHSYMHEKRALEVKIAKYYQRLTENQNNGVVEENTE